MATFCKESLQKMYDQPREVSLHGFMDMPSATYSCSSLATMVKEFNIFRNTLLHYGDGTADQAFTAVMETRMSHKLLEEWKLFTRDQTTIQPGSKLMDFYDQILSSTERERSRDNKSLPHKTSNIESLTYK